MTPLLILTLASLLIIGIFLITALFGAPFVPSRRKETATAFRHLHPITEKDVLVDFGCGSGTVLTALAHTKAKRLIGIELNPILAAIARLKTRRHPNTRIICANMLTTKLPDDITVAYIFGLDRVMRMLRPRLQRYANQHHRDIRVVSLAFEFADLRPEKQHGPYYLYRIRPN